MATEKDYFVFISYSDKDSDWAIWLRRKLRKFHLPASFNGERDVRRNLREVFRDRDELKAGPDWEEQVNKALEHTHNLIVICSPNSKTSPNVDKEVKRFIALEEDNENHIFPFIVEGDKPEDCFPSALEHSKLAGDVKKDGGRDVAFFKIVAGMLGIDLEKLRQEDQREQRRKRWIWTGISLLLAMIGFGIGAYFIKQNGVIESQNNQLQKLVKNLKEENVTYSQLQSDQKQYSYVGRLRGYDANHLYNSGFTIHPYEPIVAFLDGKGIWLHYIASDVETLLPDSYNGEQIVDYGEIHFSTNGTKLIAYGRTKENWDWAEYEWDLENCKLIGRKMLVGFFPHGVFNNNKDTTLLKKIDYECRNGKLNIYDIVSHKIICSTDFNSDDLKPDYIYNLTFDEVLFKSEDKAALYDHTKKNFVLFFKGYDSYYYADSGDYLMVDNNIFARKTNIDTIQHLNYSKRCIDEFPIIRKKDNNQHYEATTSASLDNNFESFVYKQGSFTKTIKVVKDSPDVGQHEFLQDAIFAGPNKVIAIVEWGPFRIYSTHSWNLLGTLINDTWSSKLPGHEEELPLYEPSIAMAKFIKNNLYVLSYGGVLRIYDVNKCRLTTVIELPIDRSGADFSGRHIEKSFLTDDASHIYYSFDGQSFYCECELTQEI